MGAGGQAGGGSAVCPGLSARLFFGLAREGASQDFVRELRLAGIVKLP
jgi:hypothetical protein